jgi:hypothetical protein
MNAMGDLLPYKNTSAAQHSGQQVFNASRVSLNQWIGSLLRNQYLFNTFQQSKGHFLLVVDDGIPAYPVQGGHDRGELLTEF